MNHEKMREQIHTGIDRRCASLASDPYRVQRVLHAAHHREGGTAVKKRIPRIAVVLMILLALGLTTAVAAGVVWRRGLDDLLQVTDSTREHYQSTDLFSTPGMSVTRGDVTVTLEESIVDTHAAYFAFRVRGWQPAAGQQPDFASADVACAGNNYLNVSAGFFDGLVTNDAGQAVYPDGTVPADYSGLNYTDENGDMVYIIRVFSDVGGLIGDTMEVALTDLGVCTDKQGNIEVLHPGTWSFRWELAGTDHHWHFRSLALDIGDTEATITSVQLSPIHVSMVMNVELTLQQYRSRSDREDFIPHFYGVKMKDGAVYGSIAEAGWGAYNSPDPDGKVYEFTYALNRVIEPANVDSFLFLCAGENGEDVIAEVPFNKLY